MKSKLPLFKNVMAIRSPDEPTGKPASASNHPDLDEDCTKCYFLYGYLDSKSLSKDLELEHTPELRSAKVMGAKVMMWGSSPVLIDSSPEDCALGMMYEGRGPKDEVVIRAYESPTYHLSPCWVELENGTRVRGKTLKWSGDKSQLHEGIFDPETRTMYTDRFDPTSKNYRPAIMEATPGDSESNKSDPTTTKPRLSICNNISLILAVESCRHYPM